MDNPTLMGMPLLAWCDGEAIELSFGVGQLNTVTGFEETATSISAGCMWSIRHEANLMRDIAIKSVKAS